MSFFAVVNVVLLGAVVLGIVVDRFSFLRERQKKIDQDEMNVCFMCDVKRDRIERSSGGMSRSFHNHRMHQHNVSKVWSVQRAVWLAIPLAFSGACQCWRHFSSCAVALMFGVPAVALRVLHDPPQENPSSRHERPGDENFQDDESA